MADKDYAPLTPVCVRALCDKMYDKRKAAALEIEKTTKECVSIKNHGEIAKLLRVLGVDFAMSQNPNMRKGGLIGLAAMAIGLGKETSKYVSDLVTPVLHCMGDSDSRCRFYACESLYNVTKVARDNILPMFNEIFSSMSVVVTDPDQSVRTAAELLDRLLKDIVTDHQSFKTAEFVPILKERMYSKDQFAREFNLGWVHAMHKVPNSTIVDHLPDILDPLLLIVTDERSEIYCRCQKELGTFLTIIKSEKKPNTEAFKQMLNVLAMHIQSQHIRLQTMSIIWIRHFLRINEPLIFPYISGILAAILPNLGHDEERRRTTSEEEYRRIRSMSLGLNNDLMASVGQLTKDPKYADQKLITSKNEAGKLHLEAILDVLTSQLQSGHVESRVGSLKWIRHLFTIVNPFMVNYVDKIFPVLLKTLSDSTDEVVIIDIQVLSVICKPSANPGAASASSSATCDQQNKFFKALLGCLIAMFKADKSLLTGKGPYIVRQLCVLLSCEAIYRTMANMIQLELETKNCDLKFARQMVEFLNTILITTAELFPLRQQLKELENPESCELFVTLYKTWCHSQVSTVALCFLAGCYGHALDLIKVISEQEATLDMMHELDRFIQILESPIFSHTRYELLDAETNLALHRALYGLMNLIPQTEAFRILARRLDSLPKDKLAELKSPKKLKKSGVGHKDAKGIDFGELLDTFVRVQAEHEKIKVRQMSGDLVVHDPDSEFHVSDTLEPLEDFDQSLQLNGT